MSSQDIVIPTLIPVDVELLKTKTFDFQGLLSNLRTLISNETDHRIAVNYQTCASGKKKSCQNQRFNQTNLVYVIL